MNRPESSTAPARKRRDGKVSRTFWRRFYRFVERLDACGECAIGLFFGALFWLIALGVFK